MSNLPAWIQAVAAVVQAIAAVVIFVVTRDYVRLTRDLARAASEQLALTRLNQLAEEKNRAGSLRGRASSLAVRVEALPDTIDDAAFRQYPLWTVEDVAALQDAAAPVLGLATDAASKASVALVWMLERLQAIRSVPENRGYEYAGRFNVDEWRSRRSDALVSLHELVRYAEIAAGLADEHSKQISPRFVSSPN